MDGKDLQGYVKYLKDRTYDLECRQNKEVEISVNFEVNGATVPKIINENRSSISNILKMVTYDNPEKIIVYISANGHTTDYLFF